MEALYRVVSEHGSRQKARYSELRKRIPYDISHKMFSQHLSELEQVGSSSVSSWRSSRFGRLSSHGEGRKLRERLVFHPGLGGGVRGILRRDAATHERHDG